MTLLPALERDLAGLAARGRLRAIAPRRGVDFSSNDYLGLAGSGELADAARAALARGVPVGSGGSRLLRGNDPEHEALEAEAAAFFGAERALFFASGYAANSCLVATVPQAGDRVFHDALVHASLHEGMRLTRASTQGFAHNDPAALDDAIRAWRAGGGCGTPWIAIESLYSMDGDWAPLRAFAEVAARHDAMLLVDEAHATGIAGPGGRGLCAALGLPRDRLITLHTCGKALGSEGALLCLPGVVRDHLVNRGRGLIFSTAPSPLTAAIVRASLVRIAAADDLRGALAERVRLAEQLLAPLGARCDASPIIPLVIGADDAAMAAAHALQQAGFDCRGIRPPTVPEGTARLRIVITLNASPDDIRAFAHTLAGVL